MDDFTEADAIKAVRMIADGLSWCDVVDELYPDTEYPELMEAFTCERVRHWCEQQTPKRLKEVLS